MSLAKVVTSYTQSCVETSEPHLFSEIAIRYKFRNIQTHSKNDIKRTFFQHNVAVRTETLRDGAVAKGGDPYICVVELGNHEFDNSAL
jgi:hypothetical protein